MKTVGIRELKNRLNEYLRRVRHGGGILVTDRDGAVAELRRPGRAVLGRQQANRTDLYAAFEPLAPDGTARELLDQERGERPARRSRRRTS